MCGILFENNKYYTNNKNLTWQCFGNVTLNFMSKGLKEMPLAHKVNPIKYFFYLSSTIIIFFLDNTIIVTENTTLLLPAVQLFKRQIKLYTG